MKPTIYIGAICNLSNRNEVIVCKCNHEHKYGEEALECAYELFNKFDDNNKYALSPCTIKMGECVRCGEYTQIMGEQCCVDCYGGE